MTPGPCALQLQRDTCVLTDLEAILPPLNYVGGLIWTVDNDALSDSH